MNKSKEWIGKFFFIISILMLCYLLITPLNHLIIHVDEYFSMMLFNAPLMDMFNIMIHDVHPPLYYFIARVMTSLITPFGFDSIFIGKLVSIIPYILILIFSFTKIKKEYGWLAAGIFSLSMILMSSFFRHYLTIRMYSWAMLFLILSFIYFKDVITNFDKKSWVMFTIFSVLGAYTQYFLLISSFCLYLMLLFYILLFEKDKIKYWALSIIVALALYSPWLAIVILQMVTHAGLSFPPITLQTALISFSYFAYNTNMLVNILTIVLVIIIGIIYFKNSENVNEKETFYILSGIFIYLATIIVVLGVSVLLKPIFLPRYLMPVVSIFWLTISIMVSKVNNKKLFLISMSIIILLLSIGMYNVISESETIYDTSIPQNNVINQITQENNSIIILNQSYDVMHLLPHSNQGGDVYYIHEDTPIWGESINRLHEISDFKDIYDYDVGDLIRNNSDKNIYIISWGIPQVDVDIPVYLINNERGLCFSKVFNHEDNVPSVLYGVSKVKLFDGSNVSYVGGLNIDVLSM